MVFLLICCLLAGCGKDKEREDHSTAEEKTTAEEMDTEETSTENVDDVTVDGMSREILEGMTLEEKAGQMIFAGLDSFREEGSTGKIHSLDPKMEHTFSEVSPGGVILYSKNIKNKAGLHGLIEQLQSTSRIPLLIGADEEGGENSRIASRKKLALPKTYTAGELALREPEEAEKNGSEIGAYLKKTWI